MLVRDVAVAAPVGEVWARVRDWGALDRMVPGVVTGCEVLDSRTRRVRFASGAELVEQIVACDDTARRLVWHIEGQGFDHHNGALTVVADGSGARVTWTADMLPDSLAEPLAPLMEAGLAALRQGFAG